MKKNVSWKQMIHSGLETVIGVSFQKIMMEIR